MSENKQFPSEEARRLAELDEEIEQRREDAAPSVHIARLRSNNESASQVVSLESQAGQKKERPKYPSEIRKEERAKLLQDIDEWKKRFKEKFGIKD